jgi:hypothetical protein
MPTPEDMQTAAAAAAAAMQLVHVTMTALLKAQPRCSPDQVGNANT